MKKLLILIIAAATMLVITSCDSSDDPITPTPTGSIYLSSIPAGAEIWLDGSNTTKVTPDTIHNVSQGVHTITLSLEDYNDSTFDISVTGGELSIVTNVMLVSNISTSLYGPVRIYESFGTSAQQPSGLDLSSGNAWGISSDSSGVVDIYFFSNQAGSLYLIQSADLAGLIRETDFKVGSSTNLFDEVDSPLRDNTWVTSIDEAENNYVFLYDHDAHYSKLRIVNRGGGTGIGDPAWVDVQWYYNNTVQDPRF
ncbi:MAG: PEGA domain-containing protein [Ignavibacteriaceae bacterium]